LTAPADSRGRKDNLVKLTMETDAQDRPSSRMARRHAAANWLGRDFSGILNDAR